MTECTQCEGAALIKRRCAEFRYRYNAEHAERIHLQTALRKQKKAHTKATAKRNALHNEDILLNTAQIEASALIIFAPRQRIADQTKTILDQAEQIVLLRRINITFMKEIKQLNCQLE